MKSAAAIVVTLLVCSVSMGLGYLVPRTQMRTILQPSLSSTQIRQATATIPMIEKPQEPLIDLTGVKFSGLKGKALMKKSVPSLSEIKAAFPKHVWEKSDVKSLSFAAMDVLMAALPISLGVKYLLPTIAAPSLGSYFGWILYAIVTGTTALGMWVTAHECGHGAFSNNRRLQDFVGFTFHSLLMVPYFSWQRSHQVHHANTNHIEDGETHVPPIQPSDGSKLSGKKVISNVLGEKVGNALFGFGQLYAHLLIGWPAYLLIGATGGPSRGITNHFIPVNFSKLKSSSKELFPKHMASKVWLSDAGILFSIVLLSLLASKIGLAGVIGLYGGPLLVVNAWLVAYTWLQHTDVDVPHLPAKNFNFISGALHTIDRPYDKIFGGVIDFLHHHIGSTHVIHHIDSTIPHYNAREATQIFKERFPDVYLYEPTPIPQALWRLSTDCHQVASRATADGNELFVFVESPEN